MLELSPTDWVAISSIYLTILGSVWMLGRYLDGRFSKVFEKIDAVKDMFLTKLDYHERHDDKRFSELREDIWETRLRMAGYSRTGHQNKNEKEDT